MKEHESKAYDARLMTHLRAKYGLYVTEAEAERILSAASEGFELIDVHGRDVGRDIPQTILVLAEEVIAAMVAAESK